MSDTASLGLRRAVLRAVEPLLQGMPAIGLARFLGQAGGESSDHRRPEPLQLLDCRVLAGDGFEDDVVEFFQAFHHGRIAELERRRGRIPQIFRRLHGATGRGRLAVSAVATQDMRQFLRSDHLSPPPAAFVLHARFLRLFVVLARAMSRKVALHRFKLAQNVVDLPIVIRRRSRRRGRVLRHMRGGGRMGFLSLRARLLLKRTSERPQLVQPFQAFVGVASIVFVALFDEFAFALFKSTNFGR